MKRAAPKAPRSSRIAAPAKSAKFEKAAPSHEGVVHKILKRFKPLFQKPLDPRIRHLVAVFGEEAVRGLIEVFRASREVESHEIPEAIKRAEAGAAMHPPGSFVWHELATRDVAASKRFYGELFGWVCNDVEMMPGFNYTLCRHMGKEIAGIMAITPEQGEMQSGWALYVGVDDVDAAAERAEALGGEVLVPPHDIPVGRWAMLRDPAGATVCVYKRRAV